MLFSKDGISIRIERHLRKIKNIACHEDLKEHLENLWATPDKFEEEIGKYQKPGHFLYMMSEKGVDFGVVTLDYMKKLNLAIVGCGVLKEFRGKKAKEAMLMIMDHVYKKNPDINLMGRISKDNKKSYMFSRSLGFKLKSENNGFYIVMR